MSTDFLSELGWRGQLHQSTGEEALRKHLSEGARRAYVGFDPTADSLTIGNLVPAIALARFQRCGHTPVPIMGGGTGLIGDPSGKSAERQLMTRDIVAANVDRIRRIFDPILDFSPGLSNRALMLNNLDWLGGLSYLDALRDVGKHFSVNMMIQKDSVRERLHNRDQGISYTEFSYMILQSYDFLHLFREHGVTIQMGGSDQWGNIVGGTDLIRRCVEGMHDAFGITWPLVTKTDGGKFGKTESGAVWLTPERTSPYAFYQFWLNTADGDVERFLKTFTFLDQSRIAELMAAHTADPGRREPQRALAHTVTELIHGPTEAAHAEAAAKALFSGDVAGLPEPTLREILANVPSTAHAKGLLGDGVPLLDFLVTTGLASSKREAKEFLAGGSVSVNGRKAGPDEKLTSADLLHGSMIALRRGKKNWHLTTWA